MMIEFVLNCNSLIDALLLAFCPLLVYCTRMLCNANDNFSCIGNDNALSLSIVWRYERRQHAVGICTSSTEPNSLPALLYCEAVATRPYDTAGLRRQLDRTEPA